MLWLKAIAGVLLGAGIMLTILLLGSRELERNTARGRTIHRRWTLVAGFGSLLMAGPGLFMPGSTFPNAPRSVDLAGSAICLLVSGLLFFHVWDEHRRGGSDNQE